MTIAEGRRFIDLAHLAAQDDYYNAQEDSVAFVAGLGSGKTRVASDDILRIASQYPRCGQTNDTPGIAIFSNTYAQLVEGTMATFFAQCANVWKLDWVDKIRTEHKIYIPKFDAWIGVWSADNPETFKSLELCYIWIDEAQKWDERSFIMVLGRRRGTDQQRRLYPKMPLRIRLTANPPWTMDHWLVDQCTKPLPGTGKPAFRLITAATDDNPFLPASYKQRLRESFDPEIAEIELGGKFGEIGKGRIWRRFSRSKHVLSEEQAAKLGLPPLKYDPKLPLCWSHDFNVDPLCSILFQWRRVNVRGYQRDVMYIIDEIQIRNSIIDETVKEFCENRPEARAVAERSGLILYGDATGATTTNRQTGMSDFAAIMQGLEKAHLWGRLGTFKVGTTNPERIDRFASGNRMLEDGAGNIGVVMHERCVNLARDCERCFYQPGTRLPERIKYKDGQPLKLLTHLSDAFSYPIYMEYPVMRPETGDFTTAR